MRHPDFDSLVSMSRTDTLHPGGADHVPSCAACAATVAWASDIRSAAVAATSLTAPESTWERIESRLDGGERLILPVARGTAHSRTRAAAIAAGLVLMASVGAALVPQTGVRAWIERHVLDVAAEQEPTEATISPAADPSPASAGLVLQLEDGAMHVNLTGAAAPLLLRLRLTDGPDVEVGATGVAAAAQFAAGSGSLEITGADGGEITLLMPRSARLMTVDIDGVRAVELRGGRLSVNAQADTIGAEVILPVR
ncbi:MAG TPA: hypothetical protein VHG09_10660 [Longimicrobiales bacterium]|nr:hypothetical protein [Longimicrobiales bacterium]